MEIIKSNYEKIMPFDLEGAYIVYVGRVRNFLCYSRFTWIHETIKNITNTNLDRFILYGLAKVGYRQKGEVFPFFILCRIKNAILHRQKRKIVPEFYYNKTRE